MRLFNNPNRLFRAIPFAIVWLLMGPSSYAGPIRDRLIEHRSAQQAQGIEDDEPSGPVSLPAGVRLLRDVPYGKDGKQRSDGKG